jgi:hypothetical protein
LFNLCGKIGQLRFVVEHDRFVENVLATKSTMNENADNFLFSWFSLHKQREREGWDGKMILEFVNDLHFSLVDDFCRITNPSMIFTSPWHCLALADGMSGQLWKLIQGS